MAHPKKPPALRKPQRKKLDEDLESGPQVDQRRDDIMRKMLSMKPKPHAEMRVGRSTKNVGTKRP